MKPFIPDSLPLKKTNWEKFVELTWRAHAEVARFDGLLQSMQDPKVLLSPLTTQEAVLSSRIEGTRATLQDVLEFESDPKQKTEKYDDIQEILNYRNAMNYAIKDIKKISLTNRLIKNIQSILLDNTRGHNQDRGNFRKSQVHIGSDNNIEHASYIPPSPEKILELMSNLENYIHYEEKDPIVQLAIVHTQFEIIHPFMDGNGRVGRILMPLFLYHKKVLSSPMFYLSAYFEKHREEYYKRLLNVSKKGDWENWIIFFLNAVIEQSKINIQKAKDIHDLYDVKKERIVELTRSQFAIKALDFLFHQPFFTSAQFKKTSKIPIRSAERILKILENDVIHIISKGSGKRPTLYSFPKLLKIIN